MGKSGILLGPNFLWSDLAVRLRCTRCRRTVIDRDVEGSGVQDARQTSARHAARRSERLCGSIGGTRKDSGSVIYSTAPFHPYCYIPAEPRNPYYVAFRKDHVCLWGTPDLVRTLIEQVCIADSTSQTVRSDGRARRSSISVVPVFMRVPIALPLQRLAILRIGGEANPQVAMVRSDAKFSPFAPSPGHVC